MSKKPEILVNCPTCDRKNFTERGLKAHHCKGRDGAPSPSVELTVVDPADAALAEQLTTQYQRAVGGIREVLIFGAMMLQLRDSLSARGKAHRNQYSGETIKGWLTQNAPDINLSTAYRFMDLADGLRSEFALAKKTDLVNLLTAPVEQLPDPQKKKREKIDAFVEGKSQRQLLFDFGIDTRAGKPKGGKVPRPNGTKRRTKEQYTADEKSKKAAELWALTRIELADEWFAQRLFEGLDDGPLCNFVDLLEKIVEQAKDLRDERGLKATEHVTEGWN